jgi:mRNA interferase MazF
MATAIKPPLRGEIWFIQLPVDPPEKGRRPVVIVSLDVRNRHERADTVMAIPLSTRIHKANHPTHLFLAAGETRFSEDSIARAEDVTIIRKANLVESRSRLRSMNHRRIRELAEMFKIAKGCF